MVRINPISFLFKICFLAFISNSIYAQDTTFISVGNKKVRIISAQETLESIFKNEKDKLFISTLDILSDDFSLLIDYKPINIRTKKILFQDSLYNVLVGKFKTLSNTSFDLGMSKRMLYLKYKTIEKKIVFKKEWDVKFCGYTKHKDEIDFFFCIRKDTKKTKLFFEVRFFCNKNSDRISITHYDLPPYSQKIRDYCNSEKYWNEISELKF